MKMAASGKKHIWRMNNMVFVSALPNTLKTYAHIITVGIYTNTDGDIYIEERYVAVHGRETSYRAE